MDFVLLASCDEDLGLSSFEGFAVAGQDAADLLGVTITVRDPVTDEVVGSFEPG
jgi:hypothetical protein